MEYDSSTTILRRCNSTPASHAPPSLRHLDVLSYTSLKDLIPSSAVNSPGPTHIPIRNRLVKRAAWAYLHPSSASPSSPSGPTFLRRLSSFIFRRLLPAATRFFNRLLRSITSYVRNHSPFLFFLNIILLSKLIISSSHISYN